MRTPVRLLAAAAAAAAAGGMVAVPAGTAHALSCVGPSTVLGDAAHVYAGTVERVEDDRFLFAVEEVWSGAPVAQQVWFTIPDDMAFWYPWAEAQRASGPGSPAQWVVASDDTGVVGPCSLWPTDTVADHRPDIVTEPTSNSSSSLVGVPAASAGPAAAALGGAVGAAALGVAAVGGLRWSRRRRSGQLP